MITTVHYAKDRTPEEIKAGKPVEIISYMQEWNPDLPCLPRVIADTSRMAYNKLKSTGKLSHQQDLMLQFFRLNPGAWTRQEFSMAAKWGINTVCGRTKELLDLGVLRELPRRACKVTQEQAHPLELA